jgi:hypothetical protein
MNHLGAGVATKTRAAVVAEIFAAIAELQTTHRAQWMAANILAAIFAFVSIHLF